MNPVILPAKCPSCGSPLQVHQLRCPDCQTQVEGDFAMNRFLTLNPEQLAFCELFLQCRGSLKDVGSILGVSYPTVRSRLDDLVTALGFSAPSRADRRREILRKLSEGEITADDALRQLDQTNE